MWGGGFKNLNAITLQEICPNPNDCKINNNEHYGEVTNRNTFSMTNSNAIQLSDMQNGQDGIIDIFINYGTITSYYKETIKIEKKGYVGNLINYGTISGHIYIGNGNEKGAIGTITNYGIMGSIYTSASAPTQPIDIVINNMGIMKAYADGTGGGVNKTSNLNASARNITFTLKNYAIKIYEMAGEFNSFSGNNTDITAIKNSHLVINANNDSGGVRFKDGNSRIILDFGDDFEFGEKYLINKIVTDTNGNPYATLGVDFSRLVPRSDIYSLSQSGEYFIATLNTGASTIGNLYKANVRTMNNFYTISNSMIYPHKYSAKRNTNKRRVIRRVKRTANVFDDSSLRDSALAESWQSTLQSLALNESFSYKSNSNNYYANNSTNQRANPNNQTRRRITTTNRALSTPSTQSNDNYYFILTPFVNHNLFFESGRYNLSGLEYGFLTAFSGKITPSNVLGTHFMMSYGTLGDSKDKDFSITNLNLNVGLNYKFDMIWDSYLKARGDFFYFLNQAKTLTMLEAIKPNNLGFGASVVYGKDFNFGNGGVLGVEGGIDYKALQSNTITLQNSADKSVSETYQKSLYNLIYVDLGLSYNKYFNTNAGTWGLNAGLGLKGNVSANKLATSKIHISTFNKSVDMVLDNDNFLGYANLGASYVLNAKNFDMEFSIAYYGNYGDRVISNGGGVEWRVLF